MKIIITEKMRLLEKNSRIYNKNKQDIQESMDPWQNKYEKRK